MDLLQNVLANNASTRLANSSMSGALLGVNIAPIDMSTTANPINPETLARLKAEEEKYTNASNYLLGTQQVINKAVGEGIIGSLLSAGDEPTAASRLVGKAKEAYKENEKQLKGAENYALRMGNGTGLLNASQIAPELAIELGTAIPVAGQIGKIGAIANLANKSRLGSVFAESAKWGGAEVPTSYLTGNQEHLGERVAFGALGGGIAEGLIQGVGKIASKIRERNLGTPEATTINDVSPVQSNTPEMPLNEIKPIPKQFYKDINEHLSNTGSINSNEALDYISKSSNLTPEQKSVVEHLQKLHNDTGINYELKLNPSQEEQGLSSLSFGSGERSVSFNGKVSNELVLHEMSHQATQEFLVKAANDISNGIKNTSTKIFNKLEDIRMSFAKKNPDMYGFQDVHEFISEAFSNPEFQSVLKKESLWTKVVNYIKNLLGFDSTNALNKVMQYSKQGIDENFGNVAGKDLSNVDNRAMVSPVSNIKQEFGKGTNGKPNKQNQPKADKQTFDDLMKMEESKYVNSDIHKFANIIDVRAYNPKEKPSFVKDINTIISHTIDSSYNILKDSVSSVLSHPDIKPLIDSGLDIAKAAKQTLGEAANKTKLTKNLKEALSLDGDGLHGFVTNATSDLDNTFRGKLFNQLIKIGMNGERKAVEVGNYIRSGTKTMMQDMKDGGLALRQAFTHHVIYTDFQAIKDLGIKSISDANKFIRDNNDVYSKFSKEINQSAKALKDRGAMNSSDFYNNATSIAKSKGVTDSATIDTIDKLISVRALTEDNLRYINQYKNESWFKNMLDQSYQIAKESDKLFENSPHNQLKGYYKEIYGKDLYSHSFDANGVDTKTLKVMERPEYQKGALPVEPNKGTIGEYAVSAKKVPEGTDMSDYRAIRDSEGNIKQYNKVLSEERRANELNKNYDAADILADTFQSIEKKNGIQKLIDAVKGDITESILSTKPKEGFVKLNDHDMAILAKELVGNSKKLYVPKDMKQMLIGNEAVGFTEKASIQNAFMNTIRDATLHFKHSAVVANIRAYIVNYLGGYTTALREGIPLNQIRKYYKEADSLYKDMRNDMREYYSLYTRGLDTSAVEVRLSKNKLFMMKDEGLAITMAHDYLAHSGNRSVTHDWVETALIKLNKKLGINNEHPLEWKDKFGLEDGTKGGEIASTVMSRIDAQSRFAIVQNELKKGKSIDEAVNYANSLFGNSNKITPRIVQFLDQTMFMPFGSWMYRVFAGNVKANKDNFTQALGIYLLAKKLSALTGYNFNSSDSTQIPMNPVNSAQRYSFGNQAGIFNVFHPLPYMSQVGNFIHSGNPLDIILGKNRG